MHKFTNFKWSSKMWFTILINRTLELCTDKYGATGEVKRKGDFNWSFDSINVSGQNSRIPWIFLLMSVSSFI